MLEVVLVALLVILVLNFMLIVHEMSHYAMASLLGLRTTVVGLGLPIGRALSFRIDETEFRLHAILFGAYAVIPELNKFVEVAGDETSENISNETTPNGATPNDGTHNEATSNGPTPRTVRLWKRLLVILAGPASYVLFAWVLMFFSYLFIGVPQQEVKVEMLPRENPIAKNAGARVGDTIKALDGKPVHSPDDVITYLTSHPQVPVKVSVIRGENEQSLEMTMTPNAVGKVGMGLWTKVTKYGEPNLTEAFEFSTKGTIGMMKGILQSLEHLLRNWLWFLKPDNTTVYIPTTVTYGAFGLPSFIGISHSVIKNDWRQLHYLFEVISLDLALLNLCPIFGLDGGHLIAVLVNAARKKPMKEFAVLRIGRLTVLMLTIASGCPLCLLSGWHSRQDKSDS